MTEKITIRSDRDTDYKFMYKGEEVVLGAGKIIGIADVEEQSYIDSKTGKGVACFCIDWKR